MGLAHQSIVGLRSQQGARARLPHERLDEVANEGCERQLRASCADQDRDVAGPQTRRLAEIGDARMSRQIAAERRGGVVVRERHSGHVTGCLPMV